MTLFNSVYFIHFQPFFFFEIKPLCIVSILHFHSCYFHTVDLKVEQKKEQISEAVKGRPSHTRMPVLG